MTTSEIVSKLWNLCNVLRDDGITYHQYVTELTYILFLKMAKETNTEKGIPEEFRWDVLVNKEGIELKKYYKRLLLELGDNAKGRIQEIYANSSTNIEEPKNLEKIIKSIDKLDWYSAREEGLGNLYEGLLEKNANEKKSGAGQYFTPRPLVNIMVQLMKPETGELCNDPACGTFGFMIACDSYLKHKTNSYFEMESKQAEFQVKKAFTGCELIHDAHRLALMNAMLHGIEGELLLADTLSEKGKQMRDYDLVLTNPPFGTKKGGERPTRDDFTFPTSNKQLNFLQHIYRSLKTNGKARAAVVLPDNVLFQDGDGQKIRADLMDKCNLHTILRLPTGIFYAQGVKTNVLFFTRGKTDKKNTKEVWIYDMRTNMPSFGKTNLLKEEDFRDFINAYEAEDRHKIKDERWNVFTRDDIAKKGDSLDLGLIADESLTAYEDLPDPVESAEEASAKLEQAADLIEQVIKELHVCGVGTNDNE
jgi:type I restriction enzyme M protein